MSWRFGIPDFIGNYTYMKDLGNVDQNTPAAKIRKLSLLNMATGQVQTSLNTITSIRNINAANKFIASVAESERGKEIAAIKSFCNETGKTFPALQPYLNNPNMLYTDPDGFYIQLTNALNEMRKGTKDYLNELKRIQRNISEQGRTLENYKADDYRYRLNGDISSFLNRLRGRYNKISNENSYALKIQNMAMRILDRMNIGARIASGEDFAAIAASVLIDLEQQVQKEIDEQIGEEEKNKDISTITDDILNKIEQRYYRQLDTFNETRSPVQRALLNIQGIDFKRITDNAKELLGIKTIDLDDTAMKKHIKNLNIRDRRNKNTEIQKIRASVAANATLRKDLSLIEFSISGSANSKHGTINELIQSLIGRNVSGNVATDIITYTISWAMQRNTKGLDALISAIGDSFSSVLESKDMDDPANLRDIRDTLSKMNQQVEQLIYEAELQMSKMKAFETNDIFIFHESLKLYSSVETGRGRNGFEGRVMNIMNYIDYMQSAMLMDSELDGVSRSDLSFLARNLIPGAVAEDAKEPLEQYFSMYAGMVMFDDLANMAQEAIQQVNTSGKVIGGKIRQIHLYNLNGIYVPGSMILSYVSDVVNNASQFLSNGTAAKATITVPASSQKYDNWYAGDHHLTPAHWQAVAAEATNGTKVKITFLATFKNFISRLGSL